MQMKRIVPLIILAAALSLHAAAPPRGSDRLREVVVFPEINLSFNFGMGFQENQWVIDENKYLPDEISQLREELKRQPENIKPLLSLGYLLNRNGETNESQSCYQTAERLCRNRIAANPQDGMRLMELGEALHALNNNDEAESVYRKATLVSSNEWRCWVGLGNFLPNFSMFPENLRSQIVPAQVPPQAVLDYRPSPESLKKSEAQLGEGSRCFDRAMALAPRDPEVFFQRAGYMSVSNWQNCFFRHFCNNEIIEPKAWLLAFFSKETVANLKKAAELSPKDYRLISLAAYFDWMNGTMQANITNFSSDSLPDTVRESIHGAMTRLENLSQDADKKEAAGALENLGVLNMVLGNSQAAAADFRRAVSLDPTREQSWDMLLGVSKDSASPDELVALCESRLKFKNSAWNHLLLAKLYAKQQKWDAATQQAKIAGQLDTNNIVPSLLLAAVALKQSGDTNQLSAATIDLARAKELLDKMPANNERRTRWRELTLNLAIISGMEGTQNGQKVARLCLETVLKYFPEDETVKEISKALD